MISDRTIILGFYNGLGDFVSAVPLFNRLLLQGNRLVIVASRPNIMLAELIRFSGEKISFVEHSLFSIKRIGKLTCLLNQLRKVRPDLVFVSPHAQSSLTSWKIPIMLSILRRLFWRRTAIIGGQDEKLSGLFDQTVKVDRTLNLLDREWSFHRLSGSIDEAHPPEHADGIEWISQENEPTVKADLVIHPGASRAIRHWPIENHARLLDILGQELSILYVGLPHELAPLSESFAARPNVTFFSGTMAEVVNLMRHAGGIITMDSGFAHIAAFLGVSHIALFGVSSPEFHGPFAERSQLLFEPQLECQPCDQPTCRFGHANCMKTITPEMVAVQVEDIFRRQEIA